MFDPRKPSLDELPSAAHRLRSTLLGAVGAVVILVAVVLPAEYATDPTGAGRVLDPTELGEIEQAHAEEAEQDRLRCSNDQSSSLLDAIFGLIVIAAQAQEAWQDTITFTLAPGDFTEIKLVREAGDQAQYAWATDGGGVNFDLHAHGDGHSATYERGRRATGGEGGIIAPFAGEHGWFWRNRDRAAVTVTLRLQGAYSDIVRSE